MLHPTRQGGFLTEKTNIGRKVKDEKTIYGNFAGRWAGAGTVRVREQWRFDRSADAAYVNGRKYFNTTRG